LLVISIALLFISSESLGQLIEIPQLSDYLGRMAPLVVSLFVILSCTTSSSISLEGNNLWILKSSPVSPKSILLGKVAVNLTITIPITLLCCVMLMISLRTGWIDSLLLFVIPVLYACYSAMLGVIANLKFPKLEWTSEVAVIKQSASVLVSMFVGFISILIPLAISSLLSNVNSNLVLSVIGVMMLAVCGGMYKYIATQGERLFQVL